MSRLDVLLFGATGTTGLYCIPYLYKFSKKNGRHFSWGISGRSESKLKEALNKAGKKVGVDLSATPIVLADVADSNSLLRMAQQAKVLINCCGPYTTLGKPVLEACIAAGTHHLDISGEPEYIDPLQEKYHKIAEEKGIFIISACGLDCVPCDLGVTYLQKKFNGVLNSVVAYIQAWPEYRDDGPIIGYGTWETLVLAVKHSLQFSEFKKKFFPQNTMQLSPALKVCYLPHKTNAIDGWSMVFVGHDRAIVERTQKSVYEAESKRPVQVEPLLHFSSFLNIFKMVLVLSSLIFLGPLNCTRRWLLNYPHIFSFGRVRKGQEPSQKVLENSVYQLTLQGKGWKEHLADNNCQYTIPPNKKIVARITMKDPVYGFSCTSLVGSALMILFERDKLPQKGGVYTPGFAFRNTSLMEFLLNNGMNFEILQEQDI